MSRDRNVEKIANLNDHSVHDFDVQSHAAKSSDRLGSKEMRTMQYRMERG